MRPPRTATSRPNYHCLVTAMPDRSNSDAQAIVPAPDVFVVETAVHPGVRCEQGPRVERMGRGPSLNDARPHAGGARGGEQADRVAGGVDVKAYDIAEVVDAVEGRRAYPAGIVVCELGDCGAGNAEAGAAKRSEEIFVGGPNNCR